MQSWMILGAALFCGGALWMFMLIAVFSERFRGPIGFQGPAGEPGTPYTEGYLCGEVSPDLTYREAANHLFTVRCELPSSHRGNHKCDEMNHETTRTMDGKKVIYYCPNEAACFANHGCFEKCEDFEPIVKIVDE